MFFLSVTKIKSAVEFYISLVFDVPLYIMISVFSFKTLHVPNLLLCFSKQFVKQGMKSKSLPNQVYEYWSIKAYLY